MSDHDDLTAIIEAAVDERRRWAKAGCADCNTDDCATRAELVHLEDLTTLTTMHRPRVNRYGAGCLACGLVWPCPTITEVVEPRLKAWGAMPQETPEGTPT